MRTATLTNDPRLSRIASALRDAFGARLVSALLFGSRARGDHRPDSDYDVAVFLDNFARERDRETLDKAREALGEDAWTLQFWPFASDGLAERTTLTFNIRNEATPLPGFEWPTIVAPPIMPDEGSMKPETKVLLDSARQSLTAARSLNAKGFPKHAAREAYQGALRAARALIFEERNSAPKTHGGTNTLFSEIAVRTGRVPDELFGALTGGLDLRMDLDYEPIPKTTDQQAVDYLDRAERFVALVHILLERGQAWSKFSLQKSPRNCDRNREHGRRSRVHSAGRRLTSRRPHNPFARQSRPKEADMFKHFMAVAAVSGLALTSAMAQTSPPPAASPSASTAPTAATPAGKGNFVTKQTSDQWLASKFKGTDVIGADDKKIGDVSDILFDKDKKILAYIVGVGGFLGIGSKDVALEPASFQTVPGKDASDVKLRLSMTKDELKAAPAFEPYQPPRPVSSSNSPTRPMGAPSPMTSPTSKQ